MKDFFVDYENVNKGGLEGIETLSRFDRIFLFYSDAAETIHIDQIVKCKARLKYIKISNGQPNALDFQLVAFLFKMLRRGRKYYIVSKDKGFSSVIKMAKGLGAEIRVVGRICDYKPKEKPKEATDNIVPMTTYEKPVIDYGIDKEAALEVSKEIEKKLGIPPAPESLCMVISGLKSCEGKTQFYLYCTNNMGQALGQQFYSSIKKSYTRMKEIVDLAS